MISVAKFVGWRDAGAQLDDRLDLFAHFGVRYADHRDVENLRVQGEGVLDLLRIDVDPTGDDHEALAIRQEQIAVLVEVSDVADGAPVVVRGMP